MPFNVTTGSQLQCSMGVAPSAINATPGPAVATAPVSTVMDVTPSNIPTFGMCISPANPQVAAATAAALGVLTPQPCVPAIVSPWVPGSVTSMINGLPVLTNNSTCSCAWLGVIGVVAPEQVLVQGM